MPVYIVTDNDLRAALRRLIARKGSIISLDDLYNELYINGEPRVKLEVYKRLYYGFDYNVKYDDYEYILTCPPGKKGKKNTFVEKIRHEGQKVKYIILDPKRKLERNFNFKEEKLTANDIFIEISRKRADKYENYHEKSENLCCLIAAVLMCHKNRCFKIMQIKRALDPYTHLLPKYSEFSIRSQLHDLVEFGFVGKKYREYEILYDVPDVESDEWFEGKVSNLAETYSIKEKIKEGDQNSTKIKEIRLKVLKEVLGTFLGMEEDASFINIKIALYSNKIGIIEFHKESNEGKALKDQIKDIKKGTKIGILRTDVTDKWILIKVKT